MADFDPDAYLATPPPQAGGGFDPDAYLRGSAPPAHAAVPTGGFDAATAADMAKSAGIGVVKGGIGVAGLPGDIASGFNRGIDWVESKLGLTPQPHSDALTSGQLTKGVESVTGPLYEPQTKAGQYAQTVGEFVPGMLGGPEGLAYKAATRVLAPAVASETAGQATEGTALEPYARVAGALVGHGVGAGTAGAMHPGPNIPSIEDLHDAATKGYNNARGYGVEIYRRPVARQADDMLSELASDGFRERNIPKTWSAIEELKSPLGQHATIDDIESVRKALLRAGSNPLEGAEREASRRAIGSIDNFLENLDHKHVAINPHYAVDVAQELKDARANWAAMKGGQSVMDKIESAQLRAGSTYSGTNLDNATRQNIRKFLDNPKLKRQLSPAEQAQAKRIVDGTFVGNLSRLAGKNLRWVLGTVLGHDIGGLGGVLAAHAAGHALTHTGAALTSREAAKLARMVRADSPAGRALPQPPQAPVVSNVQRANVGLLGRHPGEDAPGTPFAKGGAVTPPLGDKPLWWKNAMARRRADGGDVSDDPFEAAAARVRNAVRPEGGRQEGVGTDVATKFIPAMAQGVARNFMLGPQLMGDVASGNVDPNSEEGIRRAADVAMANVGRPAISKGTTLGSGAVVPEKFVASSTPAFKNWFGKSQVVDPEGKPLVLYKAMYPYDWTKETKTQRGPLIESIDRQTEFPSFNGTEPGVKIAGFFGDAQTANRFADVHGESSIYPVHLKMENPHVIDAKGEKAGNIQFGKSGKPFRDAIRSGKYDGVIIKNTADEGDIYIPLRPHQIKSAIGNSGAFDPADPRIHRAIGGRR